MSEQFYVKQFSLVQKQFQCQKTVAVICNNSVKCKYSFNVEKTVLFQTIQSSTSMQFKFKYGLIVKNISILSYSVYSNNSV